MGKCITCLIAILVCLVAGCVGRSGYMKVGGDRPEGPETGKALVFFVRPHVMTGAGKDIQVWDGKRCIGVAVDNTCFAYQCQPGHHLFVVRSRQSFGVDAQLAADKTYYVVSGFGLDEPGGLSVLPVTRESTYWEQGPAWVEQTKYSEPVRHMLDYYESGYRVKIDAIIARLKSPEYSKYVKKLPAGAGR